MVDYIIMQLDLNKIPNKLVKRNWGGNQQTQKNLHNRSLN